MRGNRFHKWKQKVNVYKNSCSMLSMCTTSPQSVYYYSYLETNPTDSYFGTMLRVINGQALL